MAKFWRKKVVTFKIESAYGTNATPTGAANAVRAMNVSWNPMEGQDVELGHETPWLGNQGTVVADQHATLSFELPLVGSGAAGTAPECGPVLRAMGLAQTIVASTSVTYNPISSGFESATIQLEIDGVLFQTVGARGDMDIVANASGIPVLMCRFTGLWVAPSDATITSPDISNWLDPKVVSNANTPVFTIDGDDHVMRSFKLALGNDLQTRFLVGVEEIVIVDRAEMVETQIEATALSVLNPYTLAAAGSDVPIVLQHEAVAGRIVTLNVPKAKIMRPGAPTEAQGIMEWPLSFKPLPDTGNDQFTIVFT
ncbi:phage tail tube protein [Tropicibacter sp. S64]|uniref:phage tail tube protein n=1 Tax=Tropicibacter sp. S64 TaxID=3415122 RepID=UPI003C7A6C6C